MVATTESAGVALYCSAVKQNTNQNGLHPVGKGSHRLSVYVTSECFSCREAIELASAIAKHFPDLRTEVIKLDEPGAVKPENVFAVPTYVLDSKIVSLGNPYPEQMYERIAQVLSQDES